MPWCSSHLMLLHSGKAVSTGTGITTSNLKFCSVQTFSVPEQYRVWHTWHSQGRIYLCWQSCTSAYYRQIRELPKQQTCYLEGTGGNREILKVSHTSHLRSPVNEQWFRSVLMKTASVCRPQQFSHPSLLSLCPLWNDRLLVTQACAWAWDSGDSFPNSHRWSSYKPEIWLPISLA